MKRKFLGILMTVALLCHTFGGMVFAAGDAGVIPAQDTVHVKYQIFSGMAASSQYTGWMDWKQDGAVSEAGSENERLEAIKISLESPTATGSIEYQTFVQGYGWQSWCKDGMLAGTIGQARRTEVIRIRLTGELSEQYDVYYRLNMQGYGWLGWAKDGENAGSEGKEVKGIQIQLVSKGAAAPEGTGKRPFVTVNYTLIGTKMEISETGTVDFGKIPAEDRSRVTELVLGEGITCIHYKGRTEETEPSFPELTTVSLPTTLTESVKSGFLEQPFSQCNKLTTVHFAAGTKVIPDDLFYECSGLESVTLPEGLETIGAAAFMHTSLKSIQIPESVTVIGGEAFSCTKLIQATIPESVTDLEYDVFAACHQLKAVALPKGLKSIGESAFHSCEALETVALPEGLTGIGRTAFAYCKSLKTLIIPSSVKKIGNQAFIICESLENLEFPEEAEIDVGEVFDDCISLKTVKLPKTLTRLSADFWGCTALEEIEIPESVKALEEDVFHECTSLKTVTLHEGLETIGPRTFYNCTSLERLDIPASVTAIDKAAFEGCSLEKLVLGVYKNSYAEKYCVENNIRYELLAEAAVGAPEVNTGVVKDEGAKQTAESVALKGFEDFVQKMLETILGDDREQAIEKAKNDLHAAAEDIHIYVQGYLDIALKEYQTSGDDKAISMDITPKVRVVASTAGNAQDIVLKDGGGKTKNAVEYGTAKKAEVKEAEVSVRLPQDFITKDNTSVYVKHQAAGGTYYYRSKANRDGLLTFVTRHGFSPFTILLSADVDALVGDTGYDTLQEAVDVVGDGGAVTILRDHLTAKVSGEKTFTLDTDGHVGVSLTAAEGYILKDNGDGSYTVSEAGMTAKLQFKSHIQSLDWEKDWAESGEVSGTMHQAKRLEAVRMKIEDPTTSGSIQYRTHIQSIGWEEGWKQDGQDSGTTGKKKRLEAIQIQLTDGLAVKYDLHYRAYVQSYGWLGWAKNGNSAGTEGLSKRMEAIEVRLVKKGSAAPGSSQNAFVKKGQTTGINYRTHVQTYDWMDWVSNGKKAGTEGKAKRLEALEIQLAGLDVSGGVRYRSHVQSFGWEKEWKQDGALSGTTKKSKRLEAIQIELTGEAADRYDIYYRVHVQTYGWLDWAKNGDSAGSEGLSKRLEAIEICLVEKGGAVPGKTDRSFIKK